MTNFLTNPTKPRMTQIVSIVALLIFMPLLLFGTQQIIELVSKAAGTPANIVVNTKLTQETLNLDFYHAFAQGGVEPSNMLQPVKNQIAGLKPQYIRLDHIYDGYDVVGRSGDQLTFNWTKLDDIVNTILATGAKPLLALSYMPSAIAQGGSIINPPDDWNKWSLVVQKTIEHFSGRSGKNLRNVYYEVWNEPDLAQFGGWKYSGTQKNYITLYQYASAGARSAQNVNSFRLCGPATSGLYQSWIIALAGSGSRVDCFSWHSYQADPAQYLQDQENLSTWLNPWPNYVLPATTPRLITEFGFTGDKSALYGYSYAAAHAAAVIRQLLSNGVTYAFSFELKDGPDDKNDTPDKGWGLISHENNGTQPKTRYYVYSFIDAMAGTRIKLTGEGSCVTGFASTRDNVFRILLVNFGPGCNGSQTVPITFSNLDPGTYKYRQHFFQGQDVTLTQTIAPPSASPTGQSGFGTLNQPKVAPVTSIQNTIIIPPSGIVELELSKQ